MRVCLLGDLVPARPYDAVIGDDVSLVVLNLEAPIVEESVRRREKAGPHLRGGALHLPKVGSQAAVVVNLANNHMMDYGGEGLVSTVAECARRGVRPVGAGQTSREARLPVIVESGGVSVGVVGCCETQFGASSLTTPGVACVGPWVYSVIRELRSECDVVIVSIHGGLEDGSWPSPDWQDMLRSFVNSGANVVHGHHSHVPQGYETYSAGAIFYGLGNYFVDPGYWSSAKDAVWSLVPEVDVANGEVVVTAAVAVIEAADGGHLRVRRFALETSPYHAEYVRRCNLPLQDQCLLAAIWQELSVRMFDLFYGRCLGLSVRVPETFWTTLRSRARGIMRSSQRRDADAVNERRRVGLLLYHLFQCESHRQAIATALGVLTGETEDVRTSEGRMLVETMGHVPPCAQGHDVLWHLASLSQRRFPALARAVGGLRRAPRLENVCRNPGEDGSRMNPRS